MEVFSRVVMGVLWVAVALVICGSTSGAFAEEKTKSIWVKADELMEQKKYEEAIKLYSVAIEMNAEDPDIYYAYFNRGQAFMFLGKIDEALSDCTRTIQLNPSFPNAYKWRGIIYLQTDRYTEAVNDFSRFVELEPDNPSGYANRGSALGQLGSYDKALADFTKSIEIDPTCATCYYNRYQLFTVMGRDTEAQADLVKAQSLDSRYKGDK